MDVVAGREIAANNDPLTAGHTNVLAFIDAMDDGDGVSKRASKRQRKGDS
jgi:hypothetical protein